MVEILSNRVEAQAIGDRPLSQLGTASQAMTWGKVREAPLV
ncbi:hypothetical protein A2U01_0068736, partial [Trifolium medium]|nr:hypothetical protein [Trifolium medium]